MPQPPSAFDRRLSAQSIQLRHFLSQIPEKEIGQRMALMIGQMHKQTSNAADAIGLYFHLASLAKEIHDQTKVGSDNQGVDTKQMMLYIDWIAIAGRDLTFSIAHFYKMLTELKKIHGRIESLKGRVNTKKFQLTEAKFKKTFPQPKANRDIVGHISESASSINAVRGESCFNNFINNEYACKVGNKTLRVAMDLESVHFLNEITLDIIQCFNTERPAGSSLAGTERTT